MYTRSDEIARIARNGAKLTNTANLTQELDVWARKAASMKNATVADCLAVTGLHNEAGAALPAIGTLLGTLAVSPVGSTCAERSFSAMRRVLTDFRTAMGEEHFSDMATIYVNKDLMPVDRLRVFLKFINAKNRRVEFFHGHDD